MIDFIKNNLVLILSGLIPFIFTVIGYYLKYLIDKKNKIFSKNTKRKREMYQNFVTFLVKILTNKGDPIPPEEFLSKVNEFLPDHMLYSSPRVIKAYGNYLQIVYNSSTPPVSTELKKQMELLSIFFLEMRKELGLSNRGLGKNGTKIMKAIVKDYGDYF